MIQNKPTALIVLLLLLVPLHELIESSLNTIIVIPVLSKVDKNTYNDIVAALLIGLLFYKFIDKLKRKVYLSIDYLILFSVGVGIYLYYRVTNEVWDFTAFSTVDKIAYSDIIVFFYLLEAIVKFSYRKSEPMKAGQGFFFDTPLETNGVDELKREQYAKAICERIRFTDNPKSAFTIGINGDWGVGKTSFLKLIERNLNDENIIIHFNPWLNNGASSIISEFFKTLASVINQYNYSLSRRVLNYGSLLLELDHSSINKILKPLLFLINNRKTALSEYHKINESISRLNRKLIIFIDDLDRLDNNEIIEVVRLIRNTASFSNTVFIAAYDKNYLVNALKNLNNYNTEYFLEKIFQVELHLPAYSKETVGDRIYELIKDELVDEDISRTKLTLCEIFDGIDQILELNKSARVINTFRDATRLANSFVLSYSQLKEEIDVKDLFYLELLRLKFSGVYNLLFQNHHYYLTTGTEDSSYLANDVKKFYSLRQNETGETDKSKLESFLESNPSSVSIEKKHIPSILEIIKNLFPENTRFLLTHLSIANTTNFERYSFYRLRIHDLSQVEFRKFLLGSPDEFKNKMLEWDIRGASRQVADSLININEFEDKTYFENTIAAMYNFIGVSKIGGLLASKPEEIIGKIDDSYQRITDRFYDGNIDNYRQFLEGVFKSAEHPFVNQSDLVFGLLKLIDDDFILSNSFLNDLRLEFLETYLNSISEFDENVYHLLASCDLTIVNSLGGRISDDYLIKNFNQKASELLLSWLRIKDLDGFLALTYRRNHENWFSQNREGIFRIFGNYNEFKKFLNEFNEEDYQYLKEFKEFFYECEKNGFTEYIDFEFKTIPIG